MKLRHLFQNPSVFSGGTVGEKLFYIKLLHTIIWFFYVCVIGYVLYAALVNRIDIYLWTAIGLVVFEGFVLLCFKGKCPLTVVGARYTENHEVGFDIFIPQWLARHNKLIFTTIFLIGVGIVVLRMMGF